MAMGSQEMLRIVLAFNLLLIRDLPLAEKPLQLKANVVTGFLLLWFKASCGYDENVCVWVISSLVSEKKLLWRVAWGHISHCIWEGENFCLWKSRSKRKQLRSNKTTLDFSERPVACFIVIGYLPTGFTYVVG